MMSEDADQAFEMTSEEAGALATLLGLGEDDVSYDGEKLVAANDDAAAKIQDALRGTSWKNDGAAKQIKAYAAGVRYAKETGGITVDGKPITTDRETLSTLYGISTYVNAGAKRKSVNYKTAEGWTVLDQDALASLIIAIEDHRQACFDAEMAVDKAIDDGSVKSTNDVDRWPWPAN